MAGSGLGPIGDEWSEQGFLYAPIDMSISVDLLRHGETTYMGDFCGRTDAPLTPEGLARMWTAVGGTRWPRVISSPLARCAAFARAYAQRHGVSLHLDARLREIDFGEWEGCTSAEIMARDRARLTGFWDDPMRHSPPGGESLSAVRTRVLAAWADIGAGRQPALVVTHGGPIRVLLCQTRHHPLERLLELDVPHASLWRLAAS